MTDAEHRPSATERWLTRIIRHPLRTLAAVLAVAALAALAAFSLLGVNSDPIAMLDEDLPFRQTDERLRAEFPNLDNNLLAVIEAPTPEQAMLAAVRVERELTRMPEVIRSVAWPAGSRFFARNGLLFLSLDELEALGDRLAAAQPLLGRLAQDTHAAALFDLLAQIEQREPGGTTAPPGLDMQRIHARVAAAIDTGLAGGPGMLSWQHLLGGNGGPQQPAREILLIDPVLDHGRVLAARAVMEEMRSLRTRLGLDQGPVRMRLTGSTALRFEEMKSVIEGAGLTGLLALLAVTVIMLAGLRSIPLSLIALANLALGLIITTGFAAVAIGRVNLISVSFVVLYIGLGVNYAVHYLLRYREIAQREPTGKTAAIRSTIGAGRFLLYPLTLSALTTALGFFAFVPTAFSGIAELGLIAGVAMLVTLLLSYTALPTMLALFRPQVKSAAPAHDRGWRKHLEFPLRHRRLVLGLGALLVIAALPALPELRFDSDPLNVRDPASESVVTIRTLLAEGDAGYRNIQVLMDADADTEAMRRELQALPTVARAASLESFVPDNQEDKLFVIEDLGWVLGPGVINADWQTDPLAVETLAASAAALADALGAGAERAELTESLARLQKALAGPGADSTATRVNRALTAGLQPTLGRLGAGLQASRPVTREDLPEWLVDQWRGRSGTRLLQVYPAVNVLDFERQTEFTEQVQSVAGARATGGPVIQLEAGRAITEAFRQALLWAVIGIALVLLATLRRPLAAAGVMAPLLLGGLLTLAAMVLFDLPFNFANVVALPLLLGVAVDNGIHLVARHRAGLLPDGNVLRTATARAIVVGAMITAGGFGNLAFSPHSGTASLGIILAMGLTLMVVATLIFLPAMLGRGK
ncbi:MAG: MMPL family transporter [Wenzhouxiangellaceae bacterium]|nr:MMPL family transporter [Wenzhouxiangellaceae bacterium]